MSKSSRARARSRQPSAVPKMVTTVGILAIIAAAVVAANTLTRQSAAPAADGAAATEAASLRNTGGQATASDRTSGRLLLFFMNPDGYPCQVQRQILNGVADSLSKVAQVVYIKTTVPADMQKFAAYGIRALPSLVIADRNGAELTRFAPGIQSADAVLAALTK